MITSYHLLTYPFLATNNAHFTITITIPTTIITTTTTVSTNPQTHNQVLLLLSAAAPLLPEQVMDHIMPLFTFMGVSTLRQDDNYTFYVIQKVITHFLYQCIYFSLSLSLFLSWYLNASLFFFYYYYHYYYLSDRQLKK